MESETLDQHKSAEEMRRKAIERLNADFAPQIVQSVEHEGSIEKRALQDSCDQPLLPGAASSLLAGIFTAIFALSMFALAAWLATPLEYEVDSSEREHLDAAVRFIQDRELATGAIPEVPEFERWKQEMDSKGHYRFDGQGYDLDRRCGSKPSDFCIRFWTHDAFVTYRSSQVSLDRVTVDNSNLPLALGVMAVGLVAAIGSKLLLFRKKNLPAPGAA